MGLTVRMRIGCNDIYATYSTRFSETPVPYIGQLDRENLLSAVSLAMGECGARDSFFYSVPICM